MNGRVYAPRARETSKQDMTGQLHRQSNFFKSPMLSMYGCFKTRVFGIVHWWTRRQSRWCYYQVVLLKQQMLTVVCMSNDVGVPAGQRTNSEHSQ